MIEGHSIKRNKYWFYSRRLVHVERSYYHGMELQQFSMTQLLRLP